ncbi:MAG: 4Fe-4S binding protein [Acinetobacter sp.]|nr:4Fe-4S binding protein [Acinetobacter sp.]MBP6352410.1 4Fe-4S binding protein [Acinetobacter sp.]MBP7217882.1 4Fe-4S binding protein [Acinetobacter sp.]
MQFFAIKCVGCGKCLEYCTYFAKE